MLALRPAGGLPERSSCLAGRSLSTKRHGGQDGQVGCIGPCYLEPLVDIQMPGQPRVSYSNVTPKLPTASCVAPAQGDPLAKAAIGHFGGPFHGIPRFFDLPMLKPQVRIVLRNCGLIDPKEIDHYLAVDGYQGFMNAPDERLRM